MKTLRNLIALSSLAAVLVFTSASVNAQEIPANFKARGNWMAAWKLFSSQGSDATWIMNMSEGETTYYLSDDGNQFLLISKSLTDFPMVDEYEIADFAGNNGHCRMAWNGLMRDLDIETIESGYHGKISGQQFKASRIDMISFDNVLTTILVIGRENTKLEALRQSSIAFMGEEGPQQMVAQR